MRTIDAELFEKQIDDLILECRCALSLESEHHVGCLKFVKNMLSELPTITPPPNDPLTLDELREMDGEPVWVVNSPNKRKDGFCDEWALVSVGRKSVESVGTIYHFENYGNYWLAYRHKPSE